MRSFSSIITIGLSAALTLALAACTGEKGATGATGPQGDGALTSTSTEPPGANCAYGGIKIEVGIDANGDGTLEASEVTSTTYVCNGEGTNALVRTSAEPAGANCPFGGTKIETGLDVNNDGILEDSEVNAADTTYVCTFGPDGTISPSTGINVAVKSVSTSTTAPIAVRFTLRDDRGFPLDWNGVYSVNTALQPRFALAYFSKDTTTGIVSPLTTLTKAASATTAAMPSNYNPLTTTGAGTLTENGLGAGDYTYAFPTTTTTNGPVAVAYDTTKLDLTHVVWIQVTRQTDLVYTDNATTFSAANQPYYFIPSGTGTPLTREIVAQAGCDGCHAKFKAETTASADFHGGGRVNSGMCNVCHNPARTINPLANSNNFIHRIHSGPMVATANLFHGISATYPRDIRDCSVCHGNAADGNQAFINPSQSACTGCHDYVAFDGSASATCMVNNNLVRGNDGKPLPCNHVAGSQPDTNCVVCHGPGAGFDATKFHRPVAAPDPNNIWRTGGTNANTNASYVAAGGYVPTGANVITYVVKSVQTITDTSVTPNVKRPQIVFKIQNNGTDVVFNTFAPGVTAEMMANFVGSPTAYFAFAVPEDNVTTPADFNATVSGYIKNIWNGSATGTGAGTFAGPDSNGFYTLTLTGVQIPSTAVMLTGGIGYGYSLSSTPPFVQTNLSDFPFVLDVPADGKAQGGLSVPAPDVWKVATGYTGRRAIVDTLKCQNCHGRLGVTPTFHAGQRNDASSCSFCHNPNRTSSGWAVVSKYYIHALHGGRIRTVPYTWNALSAGANYDEVEFPGTLNTCTTCHVSNTFDFTNATNLAAVPNMMLTTVATGVFNANPATNSTFFTISPYVIADGVTSYGAGFAYNAGTNVTTAAAGTTLVISPITTACSGCHDKTTDIAHMQQNGGLFYATRTAALATGAPQEQCLICHGPGAIAAIGVVHQH